MGRRGSRVARPLPVALFAIVLALGALVGPAAGAAAAELPTTRNVSTAAADWRGTGVSPKAGTRLKVTATGNGTYCDGCIAPTPAGDTGQTSACGGGYSGLGGVACIALVGKWTGGAAFVIGARATLTAPGGKELLLGIHDWKFDDNTGTYRVTIDRVGFDLSGVLRWRDCSDGPCEEKAIPNHERYRVEAKRQGDEEARQAVVGRTGAFRFRGLPEGTWLVYPQIISLTDDDGLGAEQWHPATRSIQLDEDVDGVKFQWCGPLIVGPSGAGTVAAADPCPKVRVSGRLVDALGDPYGGVGMTLRSRNAVEQATTDERGRFSFSVPRGSYALTYDGPGGPLNRHQVEATRDRTGIVVTTGKPRGELVLDETVVSIHIDGLPASGGQFVARIARGVDLAGCVDDGLLRQRLNEGAQDVTFTNFTFAVPKGEHFCGGRWTAKVVWRERNRTIVDEDFHMP